MSWKANLACGSCVCLRVLLESCPIGLVLTLSEAALGFLICSCWSKRETTHTRSPFTKVVTPSPTSSTSPARSNPRTAGNSSIKSPYLWIFQSAGLSEVERILTRSSPGPGLELTWIQRQSRQTLQGLEELPVVWP